MCYTSGYLWLDTNDGEHAITPKPPKGCHRGATGIAGASRNPDLPASPMFVTRCVHFEEHEGCFFGDLFHITKTAISVGNEISPIVG